MQNCGDPVDKDEFQDVSYKEVVIVGNGPSGIILSYVLSGKWPYYTGEEHPDEMLTARLRSIQVGKSLVEQDLQFLSQGMEGRSRNPVAVLVDSLNHPTDENSSSLLSWKHHPDKAIDHVVLGKGKPGGCWQQLNENITTISISSWMELAGFSFKDWENKSYNLNPKCRCQNNRPAMRLKTKQVAAYYRDYVQHTKLFKNFRDNFFVYSIRKVQDVDNYKKIWPRCSNEDLLWEVEGYDSVQKRNFKYVCKNLVLATGTSDAHNELSVPGELEYPEWIFHDVKRFENAVMELKKKRCSNASLDPVMIIGSGLSAADAVLIADRFGLSVLHVFKSYTFLNENAFSKNVYPEYHQVYSLMKKNEQSSEYKALGQYEVLEMCHSDKGKRIRVKSPSGLVSWYRVTFVAVMTGYRPVLNFLPEEFHDGKALGVKKNEPIDSQKNPIAILPWSYEVMHGSEGLYAMGPLVGDNVVRVLAGGAITIAGHVHKKKIK